MYSNITYGDAILEAQSSPASVPVLSQRSLASAEGTDQHQWIGVHVVQPIDQIILITNGKVYNKQSECGVAGFPVP